VVHHEEPSSLLENSYQYRPKFNLTSIAESPREYTHYENLGVENKEKLGTNMTAGRMIVTKTGALAPVEHT
jgi:hypothetical protein